VKGGKHDPQEPPGVGERNGTHVQPPGHEQGHDHWEADPKSPHRQPGEQPRQHGNEEQDQRRWHPGGVSAVGIELTAPVDPNT